MRESERVSWFSSQMSATAGASLGQSQELHPGPPREWKDPNASQGVYQWRAGLEAECPGLAPL